MAGQKEVPKGQKKELPMAVQRVGCLVDYWVERMATLTEQRMAWKMVEKRDIGKEN